MSLPLDSFNGLRCTFAIRVPRSFSGEARFRLLCLRRIWLRTRQHTVWCRAGLFAKLISSFRSVTRRFSCKLQQPYIRATDLRKSLNFSHERREYTRMHYTMCYVRCLICPFGIYQDIELSIMQPVSLKGIIHKPVTNFNVSKKVLYPTSHLGLVIKIFFPKYFFKLIFLIWNN
jgi:hypothetical protein